MNKLLVLVLVTGILFLSIAVSAVEIQDVPKDHWAYKSVKVLIDKGLLSLYDDGTFRGMDKVFRYELAEIIARILESVQTGTGNVSEEDVDLLRKLSEEFWNELVVLAVSGDVFSEQIEEIEEQNIIQDDFMTQLKDVDIATNQQDIEILKQQVDTFSTELSRTSQEINDVKSNISNIENDVTKIIDNILKVKTLEEEIISLNKQLTTAKTELNTRITDLEAKINDTEILLNDRFSVLEKEIVDNETLQTLTDQQQINKTRINALQKEINELRSGLTTVESEETDSKKEVDKNVLYAIAGIALLAILMSH